MASSAAIRKLKKEYGTLEKDPVPGAVVRPLESNFLHAHFMLYGEVFHDTPFEGGVYHGVLKFPKNYPFAPPSVLMRTPSGRFEQDTRICFSMSDFHAELWNPMWSSRSIITGLISFMNSEDITTGGISAPASRRTDLAKNSLQYSLKQDPLAMQIFSDFLKDMEEERSRLGSGWPPVRPEPKPKPPTPAKAVTAGKKERPAGQKQQIDATTSNATPPTQTPQAPSEPGKNAAKNKKKREKEKRKKVARKFIANLQKDVPPFVAAIVSNLAVNSDIDVSHRQADHVCWRTETPEEYSELTEALRSVPDDCTLLVESEIGGRSIATFRLAEAIGAATPQHSIDVIEIPSPKPGRPYKAGLEHVEFVIGDIGSHHGSPLNDDVHQRALREFMQPNSSLDWNVKARDKAINPDISLQLQLKDFGTCAVKFHLMPLADVIEAEKALPKG